MREAGGTSESFATFFQHLCTLQLPDQHRLLNQRTGKELAKLLKSLRKPSFQGKKKEKQVLTVIETLKNKDVQKHNVMSPPEQCDFMLSQQHNNK